jgi:hypothetical protein
MNCYGKEGLNEQLYADRLPSDDYMLMNENRPTDRSVCQSGVWVEPDLTFDEEKEAANVIRNDSLALGVVTTVRSIKMQTEEHDQQLMSHALKHFELSSETPFVRDFDNETHVVTLEEFETICKDIGVYVSSVLVTYWTTIDAL